MRAENAEPGLLRCGPLAGSWFLDTPVTLHQRTVSRRVYDNLEGPAHDPSPYMCAESPAMIQSRAAVVADAFSGAPYSFVLDEIRYHDRVAPAAALRVLSKTSVIVRPSCLGGGTSLLVSPSGPSNSRACLFEVDTKTSNLRLRATVELKSRIREISASSDNPTAMFSWCPIGASRRTYLAFTTGISCHVYEILKPDDPGGPTFRVASVGSMTLREDIVRTLVASGPPPSVVCFLMSGENLFPWRLRDAGPGSSHAWRVPLNGSEVEDEKRWIGCEFADDITSLVLASERKLALVSLASQDVATLRRVVCPMLSEREKIVCIRRHPSRPYLFVMATTETVRLCDTRHIDRPLEVFYGEICQGSTASFLCPDIPLVLSSCEGVLWSSVLACWVPNSSRHTPKLWAITACRASDSARKPAGTTLTSLPLERDTVRYCFAYPRLMGGTHHNLDWRVWQRFAFPICPESLCGVATQKGFLVFESTRDGSVFAQYWIAEAQSTTVASNQSLTGSTVAVSALSQAPRGTIGRRALPDPPPIPSCHRLRFAWLSSAMKMASAPPAARELTAPELISAVPAIRRLLMSRTCTLREFCTELEKMLVSPRKGQVLDSLAVRELLRSVPELSFVHEVSIQGRFHCCDSLRGCHCAQVHKGKRQGNPDALDPNQIVLHVGESIAVLPVPQVVTAEAAVAVSQEDDMVDTFCPGALEDQAVIDEEEEAKESSAVRSMKEATRKQKRQDEIMKMDMTDTQNFLSQSQAAIPMDSSQRSVRQSSQHREIMDTLAAVEDEKREAQLEEDPFLSQYRDWQDT